MEFTWAGQRSRTACATAIAGKVVRAERAAAQPRTLGRFKKAAPTVLPDRSATERAQRREEVLQSRLDKQIAESREYIANLQTQHAQALANLNTQLCYKKSEVNSLRAKLRLVKPNIERKIRPLTDGVSAPTQRRLASEIEKFLNLKFATSAARDQALYQRFQRNPHRYKAILAHGLTLGGFKRACEDHPEWVQPIRREVVTKIEDSGPLKSALISKSIVR
jgi:cell division protein ZapA (FtsZ GTPase activity inhibitor)